MAFASITYPAATAVGQTDFSIPFPYIQYEDIGVSDNGATATFSFLTDGIARLASPATGDVVIFRTTPIDELEVKYSDGTVLTADNLDTSNTQLLFAMQEAADAASLALKGSGAAVDVSSEGTNRRLTNVADGVNDTDAATVGQINSLTSDAVTAAENAKTAAETAQGEAQGSASAAAVQAGAAAGSASTAAGHAGAASDNADLAERWANEAEDVEVEPGLFSAKHFAEKAADLAGGAYLAKDGSVPIEGNLVPDVDGSRSLGASNKRYIGLFGAGYYFANGSNPGNIAGHTVLRAASDGVLKVKASDGSETQVGAEYETHVYWITSSNASWAVPANCIEMLIEGVGGGGSGKRNTQREGGGGGGAYFSKLLRDAEIPSTLAITIGAGGVSPATANNGNPGSNTVVTGTGVSLTAQGGFGGTSAGGSGRTASGGDVNLTGGDGTAGSNSTTYYGMGGDAAGPFGGGGGKSNIATGGHFPGGGGSCSNHTGGVSGAGANGVVRITCKVRI